MSEVFDWPRDNPADAAGRAAEELRLGRLVVVPTDTVYAVLAHALHPAAVAQLARLTQSPLVVAVPEPTSVTEWLPNLSGLGSRLTRHCWPGPLILQSSAAADTAMCQRLPAEVQALLLCDGLLHLRGAGHAAIGHIADLLEGPLLMCELPDCNEPAAMPARVHETASLIYHDGPTYFGRPSTVVRVEGRSWTHVQPGVLTPAALTELAICRILFVCTGNTCRSPLAMALCRQLLASKLGCAVEELPSHGFHVLSAGMAAIMGERASPEAADIVKEMGGSLDDHRSQPLTFDLLAQADCLFTMTQGHLWSLQALELTMGPAPEMLSPSNDDVTDPIGSDIEVYRQCANQIRAYLEARLPQIMEM